MRGPPVHFSLWMSLWFLLGAALVAGYWRASKAGLARQARSGLAGLGVLGLWSVGVVLFSSREGPAAARHVTVAVTLLVTLIAAPVILYRWILAILPARVGRGRWVVLGGALLVAIAIVSRHELGKPHVPAGAATSYLTASLVLWTLAVSALPIAILRLATTLMARARTSRRSAASPARAPEPTADLAPPRLASESAGGKERAPKLTRRQLVESVGGLTILGATGASFGWGTARGRFDVRLEEVVVRVAGLLRALEGYAIAQISDIHAGTTLDEEVLGRGLALLRRARPDLVVATGDLVDDDARFAPRIARVLADLGARDGAFAILGNHDYYAGFRRVREAMAAGGVRMLVNDGVVIRAGDGGGFALLGVDDAWASRAGGLGPDLERALRAVPADAPRVLLSHQPDTVARFAGRVALQLSGHTHGGQVNPGFSPAKLFMPYVAGRYEVNGTTLYVNRGLGTTGLPTRVDAPPEITRIVLTSA